jgi:TRAP-type transport system small permease protein
MERLQAALGRVYDFMMVLACLVLLAIVGSIAGDVLLRNVAIPGLPRGFVAANDVSEYGLYLCTLLAAPALLRAGQHIRVDILLRAIPRQLAWVCEWISDVAGLVACAALAWMGWIMTTKSYAGGAMQTRSLVVPEWWLLAGLPVAFALLAIEFVFRMWRLAHGPVEPRSDAVSAA